MFSLALNSLHVLTLIYYWLLEIFSLFVLAAFITLVLVRDLKRNVPDHTSRFVSGQVEANLCFHWPTLHTRDCEINHNYYNFLTCVCALAASFFTNHSVQLYSNTCNGTIEAANHTKSIKLNPPITELITITIATITFNFRHCLYWRYLV